MRPPTSSPGTKQQASKLTMTGPRINVLPPTITTGQPTRLPSCRLPARNKTSRLHRLGEPTTSTTPTRSTSNPHRQPPCRPVTCSSGASSRECAADLCSCCTSCSSTARPAATGCSQPSPCRSAASPCSSHVCRATIRTTTTAHDSDARSTARLCRSLNRWSGTTVSRQISVDQRFGAPSGEVRSPDKTCVVAQGRSHDAGLGPVSTTGQLPLERVSRGGQQQVTCSAHATADHERDGVEGRRQVGDTDAQPVDDLGEQLASRGVAIARSLGDQWPGQVARNTFDAIEQVAGDRRVGRE